jgi:hypothetical protein
LSTTKNIPAFPCEASPHMLEQGAHQTGHNLFQQYGMTLRDYFAAKAMQGSLASSDEVAKVHSFAAWCYEMADAMMEAREE